MSRGEVLTWLKRERLVPVVRAPSIGAALQIVDALLEGGIAIVEVTMTVPNAIEAIREVAKRHPNDVLIGAGTVLDADTARVCVEAGARFIVSPVVDLPTISYCVEAGVVVAPGALTPTEILSAWRAGSDIVKVFPCDAVGGPAYLKAIRAPLPHIPLMPTGGVTLENVTDFLRAGAVAVGVGGNLVDTKLSREDLVSRAKAFVDRVRTA
ncbi:MAG: bifunctional 4-hydroxy-2-oxoglutarate aldolase/2-dehydro-3-deoxy-phosphogluconate aldolase [Fimbriimonas sp.]|nr:bifunctional 4-hydroxy-2-oxoglutarate aldolase/2-dehydro-3-deoxy-phosphogluconate aldolase [Fimbriimonas sp.]